MLVGIRYHRVNICWHYYIQLSKLFSKEECHSHHVTNIWHAVQFPSKLPFICSKKPSQSIYFLQKHSVILKLGDAWKNEIIQKVIWTRQVISRSNQWTQYIESLSHSTLFRYVFLLYGIDIYWFIYIVHITFLLYRIGYAELRNYKGMSTLYT